MCKINVDKHTCEYNIVNSITSKELKITALCMMLVFSYNVFISIDSNKFVRMKRDENWKLRIWQKVPNIKTDKSRFPLTWCSVIEKMRNSFLFFQFYPLFKEKIWSRLCPPKGLPTTHTRKSRSPFRFPSLEQIHLKLDHVLVGNNSLSVTLYSLYWSLLTPTRHFLTLLPNLDALIQKNQHNCKKIWDYFMNFDPLQSSTVTNKRG